MTRVDLDAVQARNATALAHIGRLPATEASLHADASLRDVPGLVAEARAAREVVDVLRPVRAAIKNLIDDGKVKPPSAVQALRLIHTDLDVAVAAYTEAVGQ